MKTIELKLFRVPKYYCMFIDFEILNLKLNFGTLNDFKQKKFNYKVVDRIENYNFYIDHINIQYCLLILNFKFQIPRF